MSRYLLDTHVALWWAEDSPKLSERHRAIIEDADVEIILSVATVWEASIKSALGRLPLPREPLQFFQHLVDRDGFTVLPVHLSHAAGVFNLPHVHADPFDRLLIVQARSEGLVVLSNDAIFASYDLPGLVR